MARCRFFCLLALAILLVILFRPSLAWPFDDAQGRPQEARARRATATAASNARVTFTETIAPIVYANCVTCHRPGEAAPFSLISYEDVAKRGALIAKVTGARYMPPWHAAHGYGEFADERRLTDSQIAAIAEWVKQGLPKGDDSKMPRLPEFADGWHLGKPDLILEMPAGYSVPSVGADQFRNFVIPTKLTEDKWVRAVEFRPSARKVVHHAIFSWIKGGSAASRDGADGKPGFPGIGLPSFGDSNSGPLGGWATGGTPAFLPDGLGGRLPTGSDFVLQIHFHLSGKAETERSLVGLYFAEKAPERALLNIDAPALFAFGKGLDIAPGAKDFAIEDSVVLPVDVRAYGVTAHAHYLGKEMKADATLPDGTKRPLLWIRDWDFNWQDSYTYKQPFDLPKGTRIDVKVVYDNSIDNPRNPRNPPRRVKFGLQSRDEMGAVSLMAVAKTKEDEQALSTFLGERARSAGQAGFKNGDLARVQQDLRVAEAPSQRITLVDRQGASVATMGEAGLFAQPAFSPDGTRVAAILTNRDSGYRDIWIYDAAGKPGRPLTADEEADSTPVWSPDGRQIAYVRADDDANGIYLRAADGSGRAELVYKHTNGAPLFLNDWSSGGLLSFWTGESIYVLPLNGDRKPVELFKGRSGRISPDGRFIAYSDNNGGGPMKTYVRPLNLAAPATEAVQVHDGTALGGLVWRADGKALTFTSLAGLQTSGVWQVEIIETPTLAVGKPQMLFKPVGVANPAQLSSFATRDLQRFLTLVPLR
jgi:mono/diheme cytochrome c family protein